MIRVYTKPSCPACVATKKKMGQLGIPFEEIDLVGDALEHCRSLGHLSAPVVTADYGEGVTASWSGGYRPDLIRQLSETLAE